MLSTINYNLHVVLISHTDLVKVPRQKARQMWDERKKERRKEITKIKKIRNKGRI